MNPYQTIARISGVSSERCCAANEYGDTCDQPADYISSRFDPFMSRCVLHAGKPLATCVERLAAIVIRNAWIPELVQSGRVGVAWRFP